MTTQSVKLDLPYLIDDEIPYDPVRELTILCQGIEVFLHHKEHTSYATMPDATLIGMRDTLQKAVAYLCVMLEQREKCKTAMQALQAALDTFRKE